MIKRNNFLLGFFCLLFVTITCVGTVHAQVVPSATKSSRLSLSIGGTFSGFIADYKPDNSSSGSHLAGFGGYVDGQFTRWIGAEAEARWLHYDQHYQLHENQYLIGPRVPIRHIGRYTPYGKFLVGANKMIVLESGETGRFTDLVFGGGLDIQMKHRISIRAIDVEFHDLPGFTGGAIHPYGATVGVSYRIF